MTITHKIPWIGLIICLAELLFSVSAIASDPIFAKGLLWKIETPGAKPSYIFGTMHSEDERITRLPGKVDQAFQQVSSFTMEVKLDEMLALDTAAMMTFTDGKNLKSVAGPKLYSRVASLMTKYGIPEVILNSLKPWAVFVTLSMPQAKTGMFLDRVRL